MKKLLGILGLFVLVGCSEQELQQVKTASSVRDQLCAEIDTVAVFAPEVDLAKPRAACQRGDDLKAIAAAYAGCSEPESSGGAPSQPDPPAPMPPPVAGPEQAPATPPEVPAGG